MKTSIQFPPLGKAIGTEKDTYLKASSEERRQALITANETERFVNENERRRLTSISRTTWYRYEKNNSVPMPCKNENCKRWVLSDLLVYMYRQSGSI